VGGDQGRELFASSVNVSLGPADLMVANETRLRCRIEC